VRDEIAVTRLDGPAPTVRDAAPTERASLLSLPAALADRYRVVRHLPTQGAEADLLVVESCIEPGQQAVAKLYRPGIQPKSEVLQRLNAEAPRHVVRLLDYGQSEGIGYELLEYAEQGSLRDWMAEGALAEAQVREILAELSAALAELHTHHILHRDLKPANVLVRSRQPLQLVLTDFGIASLAEATLHFTTMNRTVQYSAPEAATGVIGTAADYWSLGMILVEALTGQHPFAGLSSVVMQYQLTVQGIPVDGVAEPWRTLCRGLLLRDPKQRWGGAEVERWRAGDASLRLPEVERPTNEARASRPYRLGGEECWTARELALQMARHWEAASKDLGRGFITDWLRTELHDQDLARTALDVLDDAAMSADERLLRVLVKMAPDLPPVWKQWSLAKEDLIAAANQANQGDEACRGLLSDLYQQDVLGIYARLGNAECQRTEMDWQATVKDYEETWQTALANNSSLAKSQPDLVVVLPSLLLAAVSPVFQDELDAEMKALAENPFDCPPVWFRDLLATSLHKGAVLAIKMCLPKLRSLSTLMAGRYLDNGDGTVTDVRTALQWMRFSLGQEWQNETCVGEAEKYDWQGALYVVEVLNRQGGYANYSDWRVPTKEELQTLIYCSSGQPKTWNDTGELCQGDCEDSTIYQPAFPHTPASMMYWSSSTNLDNPDKAWSVIFCKGLDLFSSHKWIPIFHVRLVRGGQ
jgi:tRNA A-37 threonylcarbamoyl transferase component Bud32